MSEASAETSGKRERKQTSFFTVAEAAPAKISADIVPQGQGLVLGENDFFVEKLGKLRSDDDVVKGLHQMMYGSPGKKSETKRNLRAFRGFPSEIDIGEKTAKLIEKKKVWTVSLLKSALDLFGLEKGGDRDTLCARLVKFLANPENTKKASGKKRKVSSSSGPKRKRSKSVKSKRPSKMTGFLLFSKASRPVLKEKKPDLTFAEVGTELGRLWKSLSEEERKEWSDQADDVNRAVGAAAGDEEGNVDDADEESDEDSDRESEGEPDEELSSGSQDDAFGASDEA